MYGCQPHSVPCASILVFSISRGILLDVGGGICSESFNLVWVREEKCVCVCVCKSTSSVCDSSSIVRQRLPWLLMRYSVICIGFLILQLILIWNNSTQTSQKTKCYFPDVNTILKLSFQHKSRSVKHAEARATKACFHTWISYRSQMKKVVTLC